MSLTAEHESRLNRRRGHTLCFECYRAERERQRACLLVAPESTPVLSPFGRPLTTRQVAHRKAMLEFARSRGRRPG